MYRVDVDSAPAYELYTSLLAYLSREDHKILDLGAGWVKTVRHQLDPAFAAELAHLKHDECLSSLDLLVWQCPGVRDAAGFLQWFGRLSIGELYERLAPYALPEDTAILTDLGGLQERYMRLLTLWDEQYFRHVDPAILHGLEADAAAKRALLRTHAPIDVVEAATSGIRLDPLPGLERVVLAPQHHNRPWNNKSMWRGLRFYLYPADILPSTPGEPPIELLRLTRALGDESRLRILRFLAGGPHSFTDIVRYSGLAKSTVHHHLGALRASGLAHLHETTDGTMYSLRRDTLDALRRQLGAFIEGDETGGQGSRVRG